MVGTNSGKTPKELDRMVEHLTFVKCKMSLNAFVNDAAFATLTHRIQYELVRWFLVSFAHKIGNTVCERAYTIHIHTGCIYRPRTSFVHHSVKNHSNRKTTMYISNIVNADTKNRLITQIFKLQFKNILYISLPLSSICFFLSKIR